MGVPAIVDSALGDEQVAAAVDLGGEDRLFVTSTRTLVYRGDGLLSDEAVEEYSHQADRVEITSGRRKGRITLFHDIEGERSITVPVGLLEDALHPVLAGVLSKAGVTDTGETVKRTFRFSELTVIVTSRRLVEHVGEAVWDTDYEEVEFDDVTGLSFEEGSVATQVVLEVGNRQERIKAPNDQAPELRAQLEEAICGFYDVETIAEFEALGDEPSDPDSISDEQQEEGETSFGDQIAPLEAVTDTIEESEQTHRNEQQEPRPSNRLDALDEGPSAETTSDSDLSTDLQPQRNDREGTTDADEASRRNEESDHHDHQQESQMTDTELVESLEELTRAVERQNELLERHGSTIEQLIEELRGPE